MPIRSDDPSPISCGPNILDIQETAKYTPRHKKEVLINLINSVKENAELTMIVDLERNDLGKICEFGSVKVIKHRALKPYKFLWHTYSLIRGKLRKNLSYMDIIKAVFPGGSITGTPKIRAMDIIDQLEPDTRGIYTGMIGYFGDDIDTSIAIRTGILKNSIFTFGIGGGIVIDSEIEAEYEETLLKARDLINIISV